MSTFAVHKSRAEGVFIHTVILTVNNGTFFNKVMNEYISKTYIAYRTHVYVAADLKWC